MELAACQLYSDKTHVELNMGMSAYTQKYLLKRARMHFGNLDVEGGECELVKVSKRGVLGFLSNRALVVSADLGDFGFQGTVTISRIGSGCVVSQFTQLLADAPFAVNQSVEVRRRALIDTLASMELIEHFFLLESAVESLWEFVKNDVQTLQLEGQPQEDETLESVSDA